MDETERGQQTLLGSHLHQCQRRMGVHCSSLGVGSTGGVIIRFKNWPNAFLASFPKSPGPRND